MKTVFLWPLAALTMLVSMTVLPSLFTADENQQVFTGVISVHERDDDGFARTIYLSDTAIGNILVADNGVAEEMREYVGDRVEATGTVSESDVPEFEYMIYVHDFEVLSESPEQEEAFEEEEEDPS